MQKPEAPYVIVSIVGPETDDPATSGHIVNHYCAPTVSHESLERIGESEWTLRAAYRKQGYAMLMELYDQERRDVDAKAYAAYLAAGQAGKRVKPFPKEKLPREVLRRQACGELDERQALEDAKRTAPTTGKVSRAV